MKKKEIAKYDEKLARAKQEKEIFDKRMEIVAVKKQIRRFQKPTTTKIIVAFIFLNCTAIEVYSMAAMWLFADFEALYALITAVVSEAMAFAVYAAKAYNETKQEEIIRLERDKLDFSSEEDGNEFIEDDTGSSGAAG